MNNKKHSYLLCQNSYVFLYNSLISFTIFIIFSFLLLGISSNILIKSLAKSFLISLLIFSITLLNSFSERYRFQINNEELKEIARSKNLTAQIWATNKGGRTSLPYTFTE